MMWLLGLLVLAGGIASVAIFAPRCGLILVDMWPVKRVAVFWLGGIAPMLLCIPLLLSAGAHVQIAEGEHYGYITATNHGGVFYETTTVWFKTSLESTQEDSYCVTDPEIHDLLKKYGDGNRRVRIEFAQHFWWADGCQWDSDFLITGVALAPGEPA